MKIFKKFIFTNMILWYIIHLVRNKNRIWGYSSAGRAPALQAGGHRFDPDYLHQKRSTIHVSELCFFFGVLFSFHSSLFTILLASADWCFRERIREKREKKRSTPICKLELMLKKPLQAYAVSQSSISSSANSLMASQLCALYLS